MIKPKEALKMYEDSIVAEVTKFWDGNISDMDIEGIREGFYIKGSKYNMLGSGMKHILEIVAALQITVFAELIEASMLYHDKNYREYKKNMFEKQFPGQQWDEYYNNLINKSKETK